MSFKCSCESGGGAGGESYRGVGGGQQWRWAPSMLGQSDGGGGLAPADLRLPLQKVRKVWLNVERNT